MARTKTAPKKSVKTVVRKGATPAKKRELSSGGIISRAQLIDSCLHEIKCIKHIATKIPDDQYDYRPTSAQRSMTELLRYLTNCASAPLCNMRDGNWDAADAIEKEAENLDVRK